MPCCCVIRLHFMLLNIVLVLSDQGVIDPPRLHALSFDHEQMLHTQMAPSITTNTTTNTTTTTIATSGPDYPLSPPTVLPPASSPPPPPPHMKVVYIIRHGEKVYTATNTTAYSYACESEQGWSRAYNMPVVFQYSDRFRKPGALYSFNYDDGIVDCKTPQGWYRTQATLVPLADSLRLSIDNSTGGKKDLCGPRYGTPRGSCLSPPPGGSTHDLGPCCNLAAASSMLAKLRDAGAILAAWEHANIVYLANALMGDRSCAEYAWLPGCQAWNRFTWPGNDFDKIVALYFDSVTLEFQGIDSGLAQGFNWSGPTRNNTHVDYNLTFGEMPGVN